jgi:ubiquinone/menaquinone biosynthesis C-methylase UbiE
MPKRLVAKDHREAYDLWATHFSDPALMANRDATSNVRKLGRVASALPLDPDADELDVGPGDGTLFRLIHRGIARGCGVDPSDAAVRRLRRLFDDVDNVEFLTGTATALPLPDDSVDIVVINSVVHALPSTEDVAEAVAEVVRVCRPGGSVFVGELPFRDETSAGIRAHLADKLRESGLRNLGRLLFHVYVKPLLRGEPILLYPATALHVPAAEFLEMCAPLGVAVEVRRHRELRHASLTRNDYLLTKCPGASADASPGRGAPGS